MRCVYSWFAKLLFTSSVAFAAAIFSWLMWPGGAQAQTCALAACMPDSVLVSPNVEGTTRPMDVGCYVWVRAWEEDLLGGSVMPTSLIQPLRDVPFIGELINYFPVFKAEKWAAVIVSAADGNKPWSDVAWMVFRDIALSAGAKQVGESLQVLGVVVDKTTAFQNAVTKAILAEITDALKSSASYWRDWYMPAGWSWGDKQHCYASGYDRPLCYGSYADFRVAYSNIGDYLDSAQIIRCTDNSGTTSPGSFVGTVMANTLNIRSGPGTNYGILGKTRAGQRLEINGTDASGSWLRIRMSTGPAGWVSRQYVRAPSGCCPVVGLPNSAATPVPPAPVPPPTPLPPPTLWPPETHPFLPTNFPTPELLPNVSFYADNTSIMAGACTTLRWDVDNVQAVFLGDAGTSGNGVAGHGSQQVCLNDTQAYNLRVVFRDGSQQYYDLMITVEAPAPQPDDTVYTVIAYQEWQNTGVWLQAGQTVSIQSVSGTWSPWPNYLVDANGCTDISLCSQDPAQPSNAAPVALHAALIGKIGDGQPFGVGMGAVVTASSEGTLYLRINDISLSDNSGSITVEIGGMGNP